MASNLDGFLKKYRGATTPKQEEVVRKDGPLSGFLNKYSNGLPLNEEDEEYNTLYEDPTQVGPPEEKPGLWDTIGALRTSMGSAMGAAGTSIQHGLAEGFSPENDTTLASPDYPYHRGDNPLNKFGDGEGMRAGLSASTRDARLAKNESLKGAVNDKIRAYQMQLARDPGYWEQALYDTAASAESAVPLIAGVGAGFAFRSPQAGLLASALTAPIPAISQYSNAYVELKQAGASDEDAHIYASKIAGSEYLFEALGPAKLGSTIKASIGRQYLKELFTETATSVTQTELGRAEGLDAPGSVGEYAESMKTLPVVVGVFSGAAAPGTVGRFNQEKAAKSQRTIQIPKTGDPSIDKGIATAEKLMGNANFDVSVDPTKPFTQEFTPKSKPVDFVKQPATNVSVGEIQSVTNELARRRTEVAKLEQTQKAAEVDVAYAKRAEQLTPEPKATELLTSKQQEGLRKQGVTGPFVADEKITTPKSEIALGQLDTVKNELAARRAALGTSTVPKGVNVTTPPQGENVTTEIGPTTTKGLDYNVVGPTKFNQTEPLNTQEPAGKAPPVIPDTQPNVPTSDYLEGGKRFGKTPVPQTARAVATPVEEVDMEDLITGSPESRVVADMDAEVDRQNEKANPKEGLPRRRKASDVLNEFVNADTEFGALAREARKSGTLVLQPRSEAQEGSREAQAYVSLRSGKPVVYINVDNVGEGVSIERLMAHESTHGALQYESPGLAKNLSDQVRALVRENPKSPLADITLQVGQAYGDRIPNEDGPVRKWAQDVEVLPAILERYLKLKADKTPMGRFKTIMRDFGIKVRQALRKMGPVGRRIADKYRETDLMKLIHDTVLEKSRDFAKGKSTPTRGRNFFAATYKPYGDEAAISRVEKEAASRAPQESRPEAKTDTLVKNKPTEDYRSGANVGERLLMQAFSNNQGRPQEVNQVMERKDSEFAANSAKVRMLINQVQSYMLARPELKSEDLSNPEVLAKHPKLAIRMQSLRSTVRSLSLEIAHLEEKYRGVMSEKQKAIVNRIKQNLDYTTRTYKLFAPFDYGKRFAKRRWKLYKENKGKDPLTLTGEAKDAVDAVMTAKHYLYERFMEFSKPPAQMTEAELKERYEFWTHRSAAEVDVKDLKAKVEEIYADFQVGGENLIDQATDAVAERMLDLVQNSENIIKYFKPSSFLDRTIVTPLSDVPPPVRKLWGENLDPLTNYHETLFRQYRYIAEFTALAELKEMGAGKWIFRDTETFDRDKYKVVLEGPSFGPLEGMVTSKFIYDSLVEFTRAGKVLDNALPGNGLTSTWGSRALDFGFRAYKAGVRGLKLATVLTRPMGYLFNFASSHLMHLATGNFTFKGYTKGIKAGKDLINLAAHEVVTKEAMEVLKVGMTDSALVGEYQRHEAERAIKEIFRREIEANPKQYEGLVARYLDIFQGGKIDAVADKIVELKIIMTDVFAFMDMHAKLANYFYEKDFVTKYNKARNGNLSEQAIMDKAAERSKRTNYSYNRVWPIFKFAEEIGAVTFFKYFAETFRVLGANAAMGMYDVAEGYKEGGKAGALRAAHGTKRLAGVSVATVGYKYILTGMGKVLAAGLSLMGLGPDDDDTEDKLAAIQAGLSEDNRNGMLLPVSDKDGTYVFFDLSRLDVFDPLNRAIRGFTNKAATGEYEEGFKESGRELLGLFFQNPALRYIKESIGPDKKPSLYYTAPNAYNNMRDYTDFPPEVFDELLRAGVTVIPPVKDMAIAYDQTLWDKMSQFEVVTNALGARLVVFDPKQEVGTRFALEYDRALDKARGVLTRNFETGKRLSDEKLEDLYVETVKKEHEEFGKLYKVVVAAKAAGATRSDILKQLKVAGASELQRGALLRGKFVPAAFGEQFLEGIKERLVKAAGDKDRTAPRKIARQIAETKARLNKLRRKYRRYNGEEE